MVVSDRWKEVVRFGIVGCIAVMIQAAVYWLLVGFLGYAIANTIAYLVSFLFNYIASTRYTFRVKSTARRGAGFAFSHLVNYLLQTATLAIFVTMGMDKRLALIPMFAICVPVNFLLVRFFLKEKRQNTPNTLNNPNVPNTLNNPNVPNTPKQD